jgi:DNA-binding response OmpR family regulator
MSCKVCIIEDDQDISELLGLVLIEKGCEYLLIQDSFQESINKLKSFTPSIIFIDISLESINGLDLCYEIKSDKSLKSIPIILMSADANLKEKFKRSEADDYLEKPFDLSEFFKKIEKV